MPLYADMYYSYLGSAPSVSNPYSVALPSSHYGSSPISRGLSSSYSRTAHNYYPPSALTSLSSYSSSRYIPKLTTISESLGNARLNRAHHHHHIQRAIPRPVTINTSDIDVSASKYQGKRRQSHDEAIPEPPAAAETNQLQQAAEIGDRQMRGTISRNRKVVRLNTVRKVKSRSQSKERHSAGERSSSKNSKKKDEEEKIKKDIPSPIESPKKPEVKDEETPVSPSSWREKIPSELLIPSPKKSHQPEKSPGELFMEKFIIRNPLRPSKPRKSSLEGSEEPVFVYPTPTPPPPVQSKPRRTSITLQGLEKLPSFSDICQDISSDKIDDDLNAGALRRRASLIIDEELELLSNLRKGSQSTVTCVLEKEIASDEETDYEGNKLKKPKQTVATKVDITNASITDIKEFVESIKDEIEDKDNNKKAPKINVVLEAVEEISHVPIKLPTKRKKVKSICHDDTKEVKEETENEGVKMRKKSILRKSVNRASKTEVEEKRKSDQDFWGALDRSETQEFQMRAAKVWQRFERCPSMEWVIDVNEKGKKDEVETPKEKALEQTEKKLTGSKSAGNLEDDKKKEEKVKAEKKELGKSKTMGNLKQEETKTVEKKEQLTKPKVADVKKIIKEPELKPENIDKIKKEPEVKTKITENIKKEPEVKTKTTEITKKESEVKANITEVTKKEPEVKTKITENIKKEPEVKTKTTEITKKEPEVKAKTTENIKKESETSYTEALMKDQSLNKKKTESKSTTEVIESKPDINKVPPKELLKQSKSGEIPKTVTVKPILEKSKSLAKLSDKISEPKAFKEKEKHPIALLKHRLDLQRARSEEPSKILKTLAEKPIPKKAIYCDKFEGPAEIKSMVVPTKYQVVTDLVKIDAQKPVQSTIEEPKVVKIEKKLALSKVKSVKDISVYDEETNTKVIKEDFNLGKTKRNIRSKSQPLEKLLESTKQAETENADLINGPKKCKPVEKDMHNNKLPEKLQTRPTLTSDDVQVKKVATQTTTMTSTSAAKNNKICDGGGEHAIKIEIGKKAKSPETGSGRSVYADNNDAHAIIKDVTADTTLSTVKSQKKQLNDNTAQDNKSSVLGAQSTKTTTTTTKSVVRDNKSGAALRKDTHFDKGKAIAMTNVKDAEQQQQQQASAAGNETNLTTMVNNMKNRNVDDDDDVDDESSIVINRDCDNNKIEKSDENKEEVCDGNKDIGTILDSSTENDTQNALEKFPTCDNLAELVVENDQLNDQLDNKTDKEDVKEDNCTLRSSKEAGKSETNLLEEDEEQELLNKAQPETQVNKTENSDSNTEETSFSTDCSATEDWSSDAESEDEKEKQRLKARENLLLLLRMARNDETPVAKPVAAAPQKKMLLDLDKMKKCYAVDQKAVITLVAKPKPLWKYVRRNKPHKKRNRKLLEKAQELERLEREKQQGETSEQGETTGATHSDDSQASDVNSSTKNSKSSTSSDYTEYYDFSFPYYVKDEDNNLLVNSRLSQRSIDSGIGGGSSEASSSYKDPTDCDVSCHKKCEKLAANLCGVNQKLIVEALSSVGASFNSSTNNVDATSGGSNTNNNNNNNSPTALLSYQKNSLIHGISDIETSHVYSQFTKTGKITPPATLIPRFKKYNIDDFHFLAVLGKGSFGKVFLAELKNSEYYYAVKALKKDIVLEDDDVECTLIERKVLALGTKHPFLCHLFATFQTDSHLFFCMEYLNGGDLMFHIQRSGRFSEDRARFYAAEIVSGLKFLHKKGVVYRDLKLDNILLDFEGHARIADFGMCKLEIYLDRTADSFCGTPDYMAPEIIKGQNYNQSVDWWSFGVLVYEMLIGQSPFSGCDEDELFWSICNEIPWFPAFLSKDALKFLQALLEKDATIRLGSLGAGDGDIIYHPFFNKINWEKLERREIAPPFKPEVLHPLDTKYFDNCFTKERARLTLIDRQILKSINQEQFDGFTYTNPNATLTGTQHGLQHAFESGLDLQDITFLDKKIYYLIQEELQKIILEKAGKETRLSKLRKKKKKMYFDPYTGEMKLTFTEF